MAATKLQEEAVQAVQDSNQEVIYMVVKAAMACKHLTDTSTQEAVAVAAGLRWAVLAAQVEEAVVVLLLEPHTLQAVAEEVEIMVVMEQSIQTIA